MPATNDAFVAFISYDRHNDEHDRGNLARLRKLLQTEVLVQSGKPIIKIFQGQENIEWGEAWKERIKKVLNECLMLIAVVTPSYLESASCRFELEYFLKQYTRLEQRLILPILYIDTPS